MNETELSAKLETLFSGAGKAHNETFGSQSGADPEWPIWYAGYLLTPLQQILCARLSKSRIAYCLIAAEDERQARAPETDWAEYYAQRFLECFARAEQPADDKLALYHFEGCPFCRRVRRLIDSLGVDVEVRDIHLNERYRDDLIEARGRATVPVLRITHADGRERWMPESADIIAYLEETYGSLSLERS
jgi:glutaredoxin